MNDSFKDIVLKLQEHPRTLEWLTDKGDRLTGVLYASDDSLYLNVSTKALDDSIEFQYLYHENEIGGRRVLHPYLSKGKYRLNFDPIYESTTLPIKFIFDEHAFPAELVNEKRVTFTFDSFVWINVPEDKKSQDDTFKTLAKLYDMKTSIGTVSVDFPMTSGNSRRLGKLEKVMDKIAVSIVPDNPFSNDEILVWNERIRQFLTFIHKERVITTSIQKDDANITVPGLIEDYEEADYAFRSPVFFNEFIEIVENALPVYIDRYNEIADFVQELSQYYYDYPLDPPDSIQLLRLFTALEQCADFAQKEESPLSKELLEDEKLRKAEFKALLKHLKPNAQSFSDAYKYLQEKSMSYFVSDGSKTTPKYKIPAMANILQKEYEKHIYLTDPTLVELQLSMRNMLAHGTFKPEVHLEFYKCRDEIGQSAEQCIRMYTLRTLKCSHEIIIEQGEPLSARRFNVVS